MVPDEVVEECPIHHQAYAARTVSPVSEEQFYTLGRMQDQHSEVSGTYDQISTRANEEAEAASMIAITAFPLYFLSLALVMTTATILTIHQLSESDHYKRQFELLCKLGMDRREMIRDLRIQFSFYYAMPAIPPVFIGVPFILNLARTPEPGVMVGASSPEAIVIIALTLFFLIYAVYILMVYTSLKRNVLPEAL